MKTLLYIADNIQQLQDSKLLMVGVYPDHLIQINFPKGVVERPSKEKPFHLPTLTMAVAIADVPLGKWQIEPKFRLPNGEVSQALASISIEITAAHSSANLLFNFAPLVVTMEGEYRLEFNIGETALSFPLKVKYAVKGE